MMPFRNANGIASSLNSSVSSRIPYLIRHDLATQAFADFMLRIGLRVFFHPEVPSIRSLSSRRCTGCTSYELLQQEHRLDFDDQKLRALRCLEAAPSTLR